MNITLNCNAIGKILKNTRADFQGDKFASKKCLNLTQILERNRNFDEAGN